MSQNNATGPVLILGANSAIARGSCQELARRGHRLFLAGRDLDALERNADDFRNRFGAIVDVGAFDAAQTASHADFVRKVDERVGGLHGALLAFGYLGDAELASHDFHEALEIISTNFTGAVSVLTHVGETLRGHEGGFIVGISSVAGDRGRQSNYVYGAAKAGLNTFLSGLRNRLHPAGVRVLTVKPGPVDTPMTAGRDDAPLPADPDVVGAQIIAALDGSTDVIYLPWFWQPIMQVIKWIPEPIFKRLKL